MLVFRFKPLASVQGALSGTYVLHMAKGNALMAKERLTFGDFLSALMAKGLTDEQILAIIYLSSVYEELNGWLAIDKVWKHVQKCQYLWYTLPRSRRTELTNWYMETVK